MKNSKKDKIRRMEVEDDQGIKRGVRTRFVLPVRAYKIVKICLILAIPVVYFICSPLLIVVVLAYFMLLFITNNMEKNFNLGLKKDLHVHLPKLDSILCILLVIVTLTGVVVSSVSMTQMRGKFDGMNSSEIEEAIDGDFSSADFALRQIWDKVKSFGTLMTGTRYFFQESGFGGGRGGGAPPEGFSPPSGSEAPDLNELLQDMPFSMLFESVVKAVDSAVLAVVCVSGLLSLRKLKKMQI